MVRAAGDPAALLQPLRAELHAVVPGAPVSRLATMDAQLGGTLAEARAATTVLGGFSLLALLLAGLGVYAMVAFAVATRVAELGIRVALGAARPRLVAVVVAESLFPVAIGLAVGIAAVLAIGPAVGGMLFGVGPRDPATLGGAVALLALVAGLGALGPAWRAARVDPVAALRMD